MSNTGMRIVELRLAMGIKTTAEFARRVGMVKSTVSNYEKNVRKVPLDAITTFAEFFDVSIDYLTCRTDFKGSLTSLRDGFVEFGDNLITKEEFLNDIDALSIEIKSAIYGMVRALRNANIKASNYQNGHSCLDLHS